MLTLLVAVCPNVAPFPLDFAGTAGGDWSTIVDPTPDFPLIQLRRKSMEFVPLILRFNSLRLPRPFMQVLVRGK